jgi:hypothetical protein
MQTNAHSHTILWTTYLLSVLHLYALFAIMIFWWGMRIIFYTQGKQ